MRTLRLVICGAAMLLLVGPSGVLSLHGQVPQAAPAQPQSTFRASTALVEVDVVALDRNGRFVPGLVPEDLTLYEDGTPQAIQQFYLVSHGAQSGAGVVQTSIPFSSEGGTVDRSRRIFIVMFDEGFLRPTPSCAPSSARRHSSAIRWSRATLGACSSTAACTGRLTTDKGELLSGVRSLRPGFDTRQSLLAPFREFPRIPSEMDAVRITGGAWEVVQALGQQSCREDPVLCQDAGGLQQVENDIQKKAQMYVNQARVLTNQTLQNLRYVTTGLSRIPGRKTIVLMSEGFFVEESRDILQHIAAQASRGGATITASTDAATSTARARTPT